MLEIALRDCVDMVNYAWSQHLTQIEFALNTSCHKRATAPYAALYSAEIGNSVPAELVFTPTTIPLIREFYKRHKRVLMRMQDAIVWAEGKEADCYNRDHTLKEYQVGDKVMLYPECWDNRLDSCRGPFTILQRVGRLAYALDLPDSSRHSYKEHNVFSVAKLQLVSSSKRSRPPANIEEKGTAFSKVESIVD